VIKILY